MTTCRKCGYFYKDIEDWLKHQKERHSQYIYKEKNGRNKHEGLQSMRKVRSNNVRGDERMEKTVKRKASRDYRRHHRDEE